MGKTPDKTDNKIKTSIWQDPRFSHLVSDPRFKHLRKEARKVKIDKRFESMFHDEKFKIKYTVDKYGRKVNKTSSEDLKKYYEIDSSSSDDEDEEKERRQEEKEIAKVESSDDEIHLNDKLAVNDDDDDGEVLDDTIKSKLLDSKLDYARGEGRLMTDSSSDEESSADDDDDELFIEHVWGELDKDAPRTDESTRRLASCNMDWDRIRASDIMVLCNSFLPAGASILSVTIYPSEFGKQRLAEEEIHGPPELVKGNDDDADDDNKSTDSNDSELIQEQDSDAEEGDEYHMEKLRQYQLNRLKYYYAVIECDSVSTADKLYKECDGLEYESTATTLDLRFIPDDVSFDQDEPKEICTELPDLSKYKPRIFTTKALYQAKVDLTWDENSIERKEMNEKLSSGKLDDINDVELKKYVAYSSEEEEDDGGVKSNNGKKSDDNDDGNSHSSDDEDDKHTKISKYKSLLESINKKENESEKRKYEMEYTWGINVDDKVEKKLDVVKKQLTPIEKALEKKSEKNKRRKEERKKKKKNKGNTDEDDDGEEYSSDDLPDGIDMSDPYFAEEFASGEFKPSKNRKNKKHSKKTNKMNEEDSEEQEEEKKAKELELLLDDGEDDGKEHFSLRKIQKSENETKSKKKRRKKLKKSKQEIEAAKSTVEDNFEVNVGDDRFGALYTSHLFNIDPTDSHYKKTKGMEKIIDEKFKRRHSNFGDGEKTNNDDDDDDAKEPDNKRSKPHLENRLLVKNLKRKIQGNLSKV